MALGGLVSQRKGSGAIQNLNTRNPRVFSSRNVSQRSRRFTRRFVSLRFHSLVSCCLLLSLSALPMSGFKQLRNVPMFVNNHEVYDLQPHQGQACGWVYLSLVGCSCALCQRFQQLIKKSNKWFKITISRGTTDPDYRVYMKLEFIFVQCSQSKYKFQIQHFFSFLPPVSKTCTAS